VRSSVACASIAITLVAAVSVMPAFANAHPPPGTFSGCPRDALALPTRPLDTYQRAVRIGALQFVRTSFLHIWRSPRQLVGARTTGVFLVSHWRPSGWIKTECGIRVWRRSVGVDVYFPKMDPPHNHPVGRCNDCARITFLASRTLGGWTIWGDH
jgi:hypothetical protein